MHICGVDYYIQEQDLYIIAVSQHGHKFGPGVSIKAFLNDWDQSNLLHPFIIPVVTFGLMWLDNPMEQMGSSWL